MASRKQKTVTQETTLFDLSAYSSRSKNGIVRSDYDHPDSVDWEGEDDDLPPPKKTEPTAAVYEPEPGDRVYLRDWPHLRGTIVEPYLKIFWNIRWDADVVNPPTNPNWLASALVLIEKVKAPSQELCPNCKHFYARFCWEFSIDFPEGEETFNECPSFDSVSPPPGDTESSPVTAQSHDSVSPPLIPGSDTESSDTESWPIHSQPCDSVSPLIYREVVAPGTETDIDNDSVSEPGVEDSPYKWEIHQGDLKYKPKGTARGKNNYFRFSYREQGKMKHVHIPGGNTSSPLAQQRWEEVRQMVQEGRSPHYIVEVIRSWGNRAVKGT